MKSWLPIRCGLSLASLLLSGASRVPAQTPPAKPSAAVSALPAAQPTSTTVPAAGVTAASDATPQHAQVEYTDGKLAVQATNASLNEILREVAHKTGMKITGGVADDRVFGSYGPSKPSVVLDALLEGTGTNMLLVDDAQGKSELILTPRRGGPSPPSSNAERNEPEDIGGGAYVAPIRPYQPPVARGRGPGGAGPDPSVIPTGASEQGDSNEPKTPQQIYEQLQRSMQQKQANTPPQ